MAFLSHFKPNITRIIPTIKRRTSMGMNVISVVPKMATRTARVAAAAATPPKAVRQLMVAPTTSTMVRASTNSTSEARKADRDSDHNMRSSFLAYLVLPHQAGPLIKGYNRWHQHQTATASILYILSEKTPG